MFTLLLLVAGLTSCLCTAQAQQLPYTAPAANNVTRGPTDPAELNNLNINTGACVIEKEPVTEFLG